MKTEVIEKSKKLNLQMFFFKGLRSLLKCFRAIDHVTLLKPPQNSGAIF